jgi:hypothetical protein
MKQSQRAEEERLDRRQATSEAATDKRKKGEQGKGEARAGLERDPKGKSQRLCRLAMDRQNGQGQFNGNSSHQLRFILAQKVGLQSVRLLSALHKEMRGQRRVLEATFFAVSRLPLTGKLQAL